MKFRRYRLTRPLQCLKKGVGAPMPSLRLALVRVSLLLNALLVVYLCVTWASDSPNAKRIELRTNGEAEMLPNLKDESEISLSNDAPSLRRTLGDEANVESAKQDQLPLPPNANPIEASQPLEVKEERPFDPANAIALIDGADKIDASEEKVAPIIAEPAPAPVVADRKLEPSTSKETGDREGEYQEPPREVQERAGMSEPPMVVAPLVEESPDPPLDSVERKMYPDLRDCPTKPLRPSYVQKGEYWILSNYIPAAMSFRCDESVTYTTHGDYTFLDNLDPLTSRWQGPVSVAVYAPGADFKDTIDTILYLRNCMAEGVKKYVTFHLFFHINHVPGEVPTTDALLQRKTDCDKDPPKWSVTTYRRAKKLVYPVNVARNTARENSQTYFNFPSDVELYPSTNFIPEFFKMLKRPDSSNSTNQRVYVFPIFEVSESQTPPETKAELQTMLKQKKAIPFHKKICTKCHNQPKSPEWQAAKPTSGLSVFFVGKREEPFHKWEPIYVGTNREPIYDERLSWEGKSDKMTQMYILCVRNYEFHILDNAFLVHRPGIKSLEKDPERDKLVAKQNVLIRNKIIREYKILFGAKKGCVI